MVPKVAATTHAVVLTRAVFSRGGVQAHFDACAKPQSPLGVGKGEQVSFFWGGGVQTKMSRLARSSLTSQYSR